MNSPVKKEWICRICWNTENWRKPSGSAGKSKNKESYENDKNFGHEEWLFDTTKVLDGYHYSFLTPIHRNRDKYTDQVFDIHLYSIDSSTNEKWWLGNIKDAWVVDKDGSKKAHIEYKKKGYLKEMEQQLKDVSAKTDGLKKFPPKDLFNVRFRPEDLVLLTEPQRIAEDNGARPGYYYTNFNTFKKKPKLALPQSNEFDFESGKLPSEKFISKRTYREGSGKVDLVHNKIVFNCHRQLQKKYGKGNVRAEVPTGSGTKIDLVVKDRKTHCFYEFKTAYSSILSIREAFGQLMEYSYFPDKKKAAKLIIVSDRPITNDGIIYMKRLRKDFKLPMYYQYYNPTSKSLEPTQY